MELSLTTFILEVVNFLVLVWILKRLFFAPIKKAIESRRREIKKSLDDADNTRNTANGLRAQYENRLKDWEREKAAKLDDLKKELDLERERLLKEAGAEAVKERERLRAQEEKAKQETKERQEREAISQSLTFLSKLLASLSSKELESSIIRNFSEKLKSEKKSALPQKGDALIRSAFPLNDAERAQILKVLENPQAKFDIDPSLLAGVEVTVGSMVLRANLRDELKYFSSVGNDGA